MDKKITYLIGLIVVAIVTILAFNMFLKEEVIEDDVIEDTQVDIISIDSIITPDHAVGEEVYIEKVTLKTDGNGGFVVVYRGTGENELGDMIGVSKYLAPGEYEHLIVALNDGEVVEIGDNVIAVLHSDNGDGVFDIDVDGAIVDPNGNVVMVSFSILNDLEDVPGYEAKM